MKKNSTMLYGAIAAYLFVVEWVGIYKGGNSGYFPRWMVTRYLYHWVRSFIFLIMDRLLRDNEGVVIMHDLSFLIRGMWIMEIGHFSFYMSFSGRLYHLISRQGDFNFGTWPKCCGMGRVSLWAELFYLGGGGGGGVPQLPL